MLRVLRTALEETCEELYERPLRTVPANIRVYTPEKFESVRRYLQLYRNKANETITKWRREVQSKISDLPDEIATEVRRLSNEAGGEITSREELRDAMLAILNEHLEIDDEPTEQSAYAFADVIAMHQRFCLKILHVTKQNLPLWVDPEDTAVGLEAPPMESDTSDDPTQDSDSVFFEALDDPLPEDDILSGDSDSDEDYDLPLPEQD